MITNKTFGAYIGAFAVATLLIITLLNQTYIEHIGKEKLVYREYQEYITFIEEHENLTYGFFGDSHAQTAINPNIIRESYNFASSGEDYVETLVKIKQIIEEDNIHIDYAVLELDMHSFAVRFRNDERRFVDLWLYTERYPLQTIADAKEKSKLAIWTSAHMPIMGKGEEIIEYITEEKKVTILDKGWTNNSEDFSKKNRELIASTKIKQHFGEGLFEEKSFAAFVETIDYLKEQKVTVVLIAYPVTQEYEKLMEEKNISRNMFYEKVLAGINNTQIILLDYHDVFANQSELFSDADHVNAQGATLLSELIEDDLASKVVEKIQENTPLLQPIKSKGATNASPAIPQTPSHLLLRLSQEDS